MDYIASLSATQLTLLFDVARDEQGYPKITPPAPDHVPTREELFRRRCYLNAVTDPDAVARLWAEEKARAKKADADAKERAKQRAKRKRRGPAPGENGKRNGRAAP